jgi:hypothetical protein
MVAMTLTLQARPQRSATMETGNDRSPTINAMTLTSEPNCLSLSPHSALSSGKIGPMIVRAAKSESISAKVSVNTVHTYAREVLAAAMFTLRAGRAVGS